MRVEARRLEHLDRREAVEFGQRHQLAFAQASGGVLQHVQLLDQQVAARRGEVRAGERGMNRRA
jgi:hypothetical protein